MATQGEKRKWAKENGISVPDRGSLDCETEDMFMAAHTGYDIPMASLRGFVRDCRKWVNQNFAPLTSKERMNELDVERYVAYLTEVVPNDSSATVREVARLRQISGDDIARIAAERDAEGEQDGGPALSPVQRVVQHATQGVISTATVALSEVVKLMTGLPDKEGELAEKDVEQVRDLLHITEECCGQLITTYHLAYCSGCGTHDNRTGR